MAHTSKQTESKNRMAHMAHMAHARKQTEKRNLHARIDPSLLRQIKVAAVLHQRSCNELVEALLESALEDLKKVPLPK